MITSGDLDTDRFVIDLVTPLIHTPSHLAPVPGVAISGTKTDSVDTIQLPTFDGLNMTRSGVSYRVSSDGFFYHSDTEGYLVYAGYFTDRGTGEVHKIGLPVLLAEETLRQSRANNDITNFGIYDFDSNPPTNSNIEVRTDQNEDLIIDLLENASDPDGDDVTVDGILQPEYGRVFIRSNGRVLYRPDIDYVGQDSFKYWVRDIYGNFTPSYVSIGVDERAEELPEPEAPEIDITPDPVDPKDPETPSEDSVEPTPTKGTGATTFTRTPNQDLDLNGTLDRLEDHIASLINKEQSGQKYNTLRLKNLIAKIRNFYNRTEAELGDDTGYQYPLGLFEFEAEVDPGSTETITIYLDQVYDTTDWVYRKYNGTTYIDNL